VRELPHGDPAIVAAGDGPASIRGEVEGGERLSVRSGQARCHPSRGHLEHHDVGFAGHAEQGARGVEAQEETATDGHRRRLLPVSGAIVPPEAQRALAMAADRGEERAVGGEGQVGDALAIGAHRHSLGRAVGRPHPDDSAAIPRRHAAAVVGEGHHVHVGARRVHVGDLGHAGRRDRRARALTTRHAQPREERQHHQASGAPRGTSHQPGFYGRVSRGPRNEPTG
jgi:hypothetical protein